MPTLFRRNNSRETKVAGFGAATAANAAQNGFNGVSNAITDNLKNASK